MKIAFIGQKGIPAKGGGVERHVEELATRLAKLDNEVYVYSRKHYTGYNESKYQGVNLIYLPALKTKNLEAITHSFLATLDALRRGFDVIHYHGVGPSTLAWLPRLLKRKTKIMTTFHCRDQFHQKWSLLAKLYLRFGEWATAKFPHQTITVSNSIKKVCVEQYNSPTAERIPNGVMIKEYSGSETLNKFGLKPGKYIMTCARLVRHKGIHYLIEAFDKLKAANPESLKGLKLAIVGDSVYTDQYVKELKDMAEKNDDIVFTGFQSGKTLAQLFQNAYLYAHPSEAEGLPITVLEAMKYGKAVLVSDIPENVEAFAGYGYMFASGNVEDLQYKLELLLANAELVKEVGQKAKKYVSVNYNWEDIVKKTLELYQEVPAAQAKSLSLAESLQKS
ncbi:glycosyltransferase family 4 protein [Patescibacteria group bacterium]|nr:glycosyltransferase family 4 protein [Patescibacteria group bacterium]